MRIKAKLLEIKMSGSTEECYFQCTDEKGNSWNKTVKISSNKVDTEKVKELLVEQLQKDLGIKELNKEKLKELKKEFSIEVLTAYENPTKSKEIG